MEQTNQSLVQGTPVDTLVNEHKTTEILPPQQVDVRESDPKPMKSQQNQRQFLQARHANWINFLAVFINACLFYYSVKVWQETKKATDTAVAAFQETIASNRTSDSVTAIALKISQQNADAVTAASEEARKSNETSSEMYRLSRYTADSTFKQNREANENYLKTSQAMLTVSETSMKAQVTQVEEAVKKFELENQPFVEFFIPHIVKLDSGHRLQLATKLINIGNYPVKLANTGFYCAIGPEKPIYKEVYKKENLRPECLWRLVAKDNPVEFPSIFGPMVSREDHHALHDGKSHIFFAGWVQFQNLLTTELIDYKFHIKITLYPFYNVEHLIVPYVPEGYRQ